MSTTAREAHWKSPSSADSRTGDTECYCPFVEPDAAPGLPDTCCTISVSPLLRELLLKVAGFPETYALGGREDRLIAALLDELVAAPVEDLHLPMHAKLSHGSAPPVAEHP